MVNNTQNQALTQMQTFKHCIGGENNNIGVDFHENITLSPTQLCELLSKHMKEVPSLVKEPSIRLSRYSAMDVTEEDKNLSEEELLERCLKHDQQSFARMLVETIVTRTDLTVSASELYALTDFESLCQGLATLVPHYRDLKLKDLRYGGSCARQVLQTQPPFTSEPSTNKQAELCVYIESLELD